MTTPAAQASFDDLGTPLSELTYCVVDLETTGGAETDRITEIGAVKVRGGEVVGEFQTLVNPRTHVPPLIAVLTGITNAMVAAAPTLREVLPAFLAFAEGTVVVAHNAPFDTGFLRRACEGLGYPSPRWPVLDTASLARVILLRDEVPNCKLGTLARHFRTTVTPNHRALTDAQATVDVLHGLIERVGNLGVHTLEDLQEFSRRVSPQRRSKRTWAAGLPETAGVYLFVAEEAAGAGTPGGQASRHVLYVGKSKNLRARVRTYFTAAEKRRRMDEMVRLATGVETIPCDTQLQADVLELRLIAAHAPRYNRRSKFPERMTWVKITTDVFPRLSIVGAVRDDGATYFGPFGRRQAAEDVVLAVYDGFPLRQCTARLSPTRPTNACALAAMGRCCAPCDGSVGPEEYSALVERVRAALCSDARPAVSAVSARLTRLVGERRFEEAETIRRRLETLARTARRFHGCRAWRPVRRSSPRAARVRAGTSTWCATAASRAPASPVRTTSRRPWHAARSRPPRRYDRRRGPCPRRGSRRRSASPTGSSSPGCGSCTSRATGPGPCTRCSTTRRWSSTPWAASGRCSPRRPAPSPTPTTLGWRTW